MLTDAPAKTQDRPGDLAAPAEMLYLLNVETGRILPWTPILAVKKGWVDCDALGNPLRRDDVQGDHPYIIQETRALRERMEAAGASPHTVEDFGRHLTEQGEEKFRRLEYEREEVAQIEHRPSASHVEKHSDDPIMARIEAKIDRMAQEALEEIGDMALAYLHHLAGLTPRLTPGWRREVSEYVVRKRVAEAINAAP